MVQVQTNISIIIITLGVSGVIWCPVMVQMRRKNSRRVYFYVRHTLGNTQSSDPARTALIVSKLGRRVFARGALPLAQALSLMFTLPKYYSLSLSLAHTSSSLSSLRSNWAFSFPLVFVLLAKCCRLLFSCLLISFSPETNTPMIWIHYSFCALLLSPFPPSLRPSSNAPRSDP